MSISFSPKEAIASIAKSIILSSAAINIPHEQAEFVGGMLEGIIKGISGREKSIYQQLNNIIKQAIEKTILQNQNYEIPEDCLDSIMDAFSFDNAIDYLKSPNPVQKINDAIKSACSKSEDCDISTLPIVDMAESLLKQIHCDINKSHELSALFSMVLTEEINRKLDVITQLVKNEQLNNITNVDTQEYITNISTESAEKYKGYFQSNLFSEKERQDSIRLCDVYIDSTIFDSEGNEYSDFEALYNAFPDEEVLLLEGAAGSGKSSLLMRIADRYLKKEIFQGKKLFFVQGKEIRHSKGMPMDDLLMALKLNKEDSLDGSIVFLDAYDEISYAATSSEKNREYLDRLLQNREGFTLIITVRADYIRAFNGLRFQIKGFSPKQRKTFLEKYNSRRSDEHKLKNTYIDSLSKEDSFYEDEINELISIPMFLYMIAVGNVDVSVIEDKFDLFELVFVPNNQNAMVSRGNDSKVISKKIWNDSYSLALNISKSMFFNNDSFVTENSIRTFIDNMDISNETKNLLNNRFGVEIFLSGNNSNIYTFMHRSIFEYFTAKCICAELQNIILRYIHKDIDISDVVIGINNVFPADYYSESIFYYVMYAIHKGYLIDDTLILKKNLLCIEDMFQKLISSQLCNSGSDSIPYIIRLKNLLLWVFNTFSALFGLFEIDDNPHWVNINHLVLQYMLRIKEPEDTLFISHCKLRKISFYKFDLGSVYFIDNDLSYALFRETNCQEITSVGQSYENIYFHSADFWNSDFSECSFDNSDLRFADFRNANLCKTSFRNADLRCGLFSNADLSGANFAGAHIYLNDFENAIYDNDAFKNAIIHNLDTDDPDESVLMLESNK